MKQLWYL